MILAAIMLMVWWLMFWPPRWVIALGTALEIARHTTACALSQPRPEGEVR